MTTDNLKNAGPLYCGFDWSTQQIKLVVVDANLQVVCEEAVNFDRDLPHYGTKGGCNANGLEVTAPTVMWVEALDMLLERLKARNFPFGNVKGVSGCGQQHGSVYWKHGSESVLKSLDVKTSLLEQLKSQFSIDRSPIWQDCSTGEQCRTIEAAVNGAQRLAEITGSSGYERFTGNQILKIVQTQPEAYTATSRIALVSSFCTSLFVQSFAPIDASDGSGMNLLDIHKQDWSEEVLKAAAGNDKEGAAGLRKRLGKVGAVDEVAGVVGSYFQQKYGFSADVPVTVFTGDNPSSLSSLHPAPTDIIISLGTSDTLFFSTPDPHPSTEGHILVHPFQPKQFMAMVVYKNGSLARERIRDESCGANWNKFEEAVQKTEGQGVEAGNVGFYNFDDQITPRVSAGVHKFSTGQEVKDFADPALNARAILEDRFISMRARSLRMGAPEARRVIVTGGASHNKSIQNIIAHIFSASVYTADIGPNSASVGGAVRAKFGAENAKWGSDGYERMVREAVGDKDGMVEVVKWEEGKVGLKESAVRVWEEAERKILAK
ncbi:hypothetical protein HDV00_010411 [Rhizophlyctis rosea]|nr:hypothetical protein HDV00_010411 [Rhizophlyctis rosea]